LVFNWYYISTLEILMPLRETEQSHDKSANIDILDGASILEILLDSQLNAVSAVKSPLPAIDKAAELMASTIENNGVLTYAGAGSPGLIGLTDGLELPGTFGINLDSIRILIAGGKASLTDLAGGYEDDEIAARHDASVIKANDCVIATSASGTTAYPVAVAKVARDLGAHVIGISNTPNSILLEISDIPVFLPTPAEVIAGSTRLGAGSAQKVALNMMSSLMGVRLGHVYDGYMVNLCADNKKLTDRASRIVANIAKCSVDAALESLALTNGSVKHAVLMIVGGCDFGQAEKFLEAANQHLRKAISRLKMSSGSIKH
jgi:N-acetylmuramic acid 6-phosphate etherase